MAVKSVRLGPKSPLAGGAPAEATPAGPAEEPVVAGDGRVGCGCGKVGDLGGRKATVVRDGFEHRYGLPCRPLPERHGREGDQALPVVGVESVFAEMRRRINEREAIGVKRYGRSLETFNGRDAGRDLEDELLDALAYATQLRLERRALAEALRALAGHVRGGRAPAAAGTVEAALELAQKLEATRV
jgi:hypothetical protein